MQKFAVITHTSPDSGQALTLDLALPSYSLALSGYNAQNYRRQLLQSSCY